MWDALELEWPFRVVLIWGKGSRPLYPCIDSHGWSRLSLGTGHDALWAGKVYPTLEYIYSRQDETILSQNGKGPMDLPQSIWLFFSGMELYQGSISAAIIDSLDTQ